MLGGDYSTKLSPWLALGCLSPRWLYHELKRYEAKRVANKSTYWIAFELLWRDFYHFFALKHGTRIFFEFGITGKAMTWNPDVEVRIHPVLASTGQPGAELHPQPHVAAVQVFERWKAGQTGLPLVDANMRELAATGFMSNRGRQNVASYLVLDLGVDWRLGAAWFEHQLLDHDVASNWGNWVAAAGLTGGRVNKFNILKQSKDYDPAGDYVRTWLPELANVPTTYVHEPAAMPKAVQTAVGVVIGRDYPAPVPARQMVRNFGTRGSSPDGPMGGGRRQARGKGRGGRGPRKPCLLYTSPSPRD